jgi:tyrosine-protein phosphatase SIW14
MDNLRPPPGFHQIDDGVFASSYPAKKTHTFLLSLSLKTIIALQPSDIKSDLRIFCQQEAIRLEAIQVDVNHEPFVATSAESIDNVLNVVMNVHSRPLLIFCNNGRLRTSCVVGCYRKSCEWSLVSIISEFEQWADSEGGCADIQFMENYVYSHASGGAVAPAKS